MNQIIYIQKYIYKYKNHYVINDTDLKKLLNINIEKIIKKHKKIFNNEFCYKLKKAYLLKKEGIILISVIIDSYCFDEIIGYILDTFYILEKINNSILNKISQELL